MPCDCGAGSDAVLRAITATTANLAPGANRLASVLRLYLQAAAADGGLAQALAAGASGILDPDHALRSPLSDDILQAMRQGQFHDVSIDEALDLIVGGMVAALYRIARRAVPHDYPERIVAGIMRSLGMSVRQARALAASGASHACKGSADHDRHAGGVGCRSAWQSGLSQAVRQGGEIVRIMDR